MREEIVIYLSGRPGNPFLAEAARLLAAPPGSASAGAGKDWERLYRLAMKKATHFQALAAQAGETVEELQQALNTLAAEYSNLRARPATPPAAAGAWVVLRDTLLVAVDEWEGTRDCWLDADDREQLLETLATVLLPCAS